jgi:hypothetical protein
MRTASLVWVLILSTSVWAQSKTVVVAGGDCSDPSLISAAKDFRDSAAKLPDAHLMEPESVLDIVRPRPTRSLQDIERQLESARSLHFSGQDPRALELIERALIELERASPDARPWPLTQSALELQAMVQSALEHFKEMNDALRRIVRLDPTLKLDTNKSPPSVVAGVEALKKEFARTRKSTLLVRVDAGPAATVFIDGQPMGATPLKIELVPGTYRVSLSSPGMLSFPHRVELPRDTKLNVDLAFEGSLGLQVPLCLSGTDDGSAIKLGQLVAADKVIVLRNTAKRGGPPFISGTLFKLADGQQERSGSVMPELLPNLATFLITGKELPGIRMDAPAKPVAAIVKEPVKEPVTEPAKEPVKDAPKATVGQPPPAPVVEATQPTFNVSGSVSAGRVGSYTLIGVGAVSVIVGAVLFGSYADARDRLVGITRTDGKLPLYELTVGKEALELMKTIDTNRVLSFALIGGGIGAAAAGALGMLLFPAQNTKVAMSVSPGGASVQVSGSF